MARSSRSARASSWRTRSRVMPRFVPDLLERARPDAVEAEALDDDAPLARLELAERVEKLRRAGPVGSLDLGLLGVHVRDEVGDARVAVADRRLEAHGVEDELEQLLHALGSDVDLGRDLLERRIAVELLAEQPACLRDLANLVGDVDREADRAALLCERARDRLLDPPRRVRGELEAHACSRTSRPRG